MAPSSSNTPGTTARLSVNLSAIKANYNTLKALAGSATCAGVVKANAYGLGVKPVSKALWAAGCRQFCVALLSEAVILRKQLPDAVIYVLNGLMKGAAVDYHHIDVRPVLASIEEIDEWSNYCREKNTPLPAAAHVDTGINRLGIEYQDALQYFHNTKRCKDFRLCMVMSHLACADEPSHALNAEQVTKFATLRSYMPEGVTFSLANSAGTLSGPQAHFDMVRPGIALYGSNPLGKTNTRLETVVTLEAAILQVRNVDAGQSVGYGATFVCQRPAKIAVIALGYADGYPRNLSSSNAQTRAYVSIAGHRAPIIGRISMDMIGVDVTDLPPNTAMRGVMAEVIGKNISLDGVAHASETISYDVLTRLGNRFDRVYT